MRTDEADATLMRVSTESLAGINLTLRAHETGAAAGRFPHLKLTCTKPHTTDRCSNEDVSDLRTPYIHSSIYIVCSTVRGSSRSSSMIHVR